MDTKPKTPVMQVLFTLSEMSRITDSFLETLSRYCHGRIANGVLSSTGDR